MPTSNLETIEPIMRKVMEINPDRVIDVGIGFGKYGLLVREYLEVVKSRKYFKEEWTRRIDGIEVFEKYVLPHHVEIYDHIYNIDANDVEKLSRVLIHGYDLALMCDTLEHCYNWEKVLNALSVVPKLIVTVPMGEFVQGDVFDNPFEKHLVTFTPESVKPYFEHVEVIKDSIFCYR